MQVMFIFIFLTIFYFTYVAGVEKNEFISQIDFIVDDLTTEGQQGIDNTLKTVEGDRYTLLSVVDGLIDSLEQKAVDQTISTNNDIEVINEGVQTRSYELLAMICPAIFGIVVIFTILGYCTKLWSSVMQGLLAVGFVALTEFSFLMLITSQYQAADPNQVKRSFGTKVQEWILASKASGKIKQ